MRVSDGGEGSERRKIALILRGVLCFFSTLLHCIVEQSKHKHDNCSRHPQQAGGCGEHTQRSEQTYSVAHLRRWVQLSSSERQHQERGFDSGAAAVSVRAGSRALMALRPRLS